MEAHERTLGLVRLAQRQVHLAQLLLQRRPLVAQIRKLRGAGRSVRADGRPQLAREAVEHGAAHRVVLAVVLLANLVTFGGI